MFELFILLIAILIVSGIYFDLRKTELKFETVFLEHKRAALEVEASQTIGNHLAIEVGDTVYSKRRTGIIIRKIENGVFEVETKEGDTGMVLYDEIIRLDKGTEYLDTTMQDLYNII